MAANCLKEKSKLIRCLVLLLAVLVIVLIALFVNLVLRKDDHACHSEGCIRASAEILRFVDQAAGPCDDFHAFSCGGFIKDVKGLPPPEPEAELDFAIAEAANGNDSRPFAMQKLFYRACANLAAIDLDEDETMLAAFYVLGDWPVLRGANWDGTLFDWVEVVKKSRQAGMKFDWFLEFSVFEDRNDTGTNVMKVGIPGSLRRVDEREKHARKDLLTDVAEVMGAPKYLAHYETAKTIEFEDELAMLVESHLNREKERHPWLLPKLTINELQLLLPNIQWLDLLNTVTKDRMDSNSYVIFDVFDYIKDLTKLILGTPKRIVADYMMWKIVEEKWQYLSQPIREKFEKYEEEVYHRQPQLDRQRFCLEESKKQFPLVAESDFIRRHVTEQKRQLVREMLYNIRHRYIELLEASSWMGRESRRRAQFRLENVKFLVGGPEEVFDQFRFADNLGLYGFAFKSSNVIDMLHERRGRLYDRRFAVVNRGITNNTVAFYQEVVNITGFALLNQNTIVIPAALLRDSVYDLNLPNYLNYGSLGRALSSQVFEHVFKRKNSTLADEEDSSFDSRRAADVFDQAIKCLVKESSFFHNAELRRSTTMREYLVDFVAVDVAYESYKFWLRMLSDEFALPGLKFTPLQLFWIQASKTLCSKIFTRHHRESSRFKIIAPLRNSKHFARDFYCPEGSKMNPRKKCRVL